MLLSVQSDTINPRLRLTISVQRFPAPSETFIVTKVLGLLDRGFDVQIFTSAPSSDWGCFQVLAGREDVRRRIHVAPPTDSLRKILTIGLLILLKTLLRHPLEFFRFARHCWKYRKSHPLGFLKALYSRLHFVGHRADVLHIEFDTLALGLTDMTYYLGSKLLLSARGTFQKMSVIDRYPDAPQRIYADVDGYHFISQYLHRNALKLGLNPAVPTWLIEPAIDLTLFTAQQRTSNALGAPLKLITVARLAWQKGYEFAVDAVALVHKAGVPIEYHIIGEGPYREPVEFAARQWGLLQNGIIRFVGAVPREQVVKHLTESDIMIHAAVEEGFCNAVIEGQAAGLPVVCSDAGGLPENVEDGVTGFVVPRRNPEAMAEKIIQLAHDPELRKRMGEAGRVRAQNRFDLNHQIEAFTRLYQELAAREQ